MVQRFLDSLDAFREGSISILDLSAQAGSVAQSIDHSNDPLPEMLVAIASRLELVHFTSNEADHAVEADRVVAPLLEALT